jgi:anaerobic selenocysteine-containing dehydrogenase
MRPEARDVREGEGKSLKSQASSLKPQKTEPERDVFYTTCPYNCWPVNCGMSLEVKGNKVVSVAGNPHHDIGRGRLCVKGQSAAQIIYSDKRLLYPRERIRGKKKDVWKRVSWEHALNSIAGRMTDNIHRGRREANALYHSHGNIVQRVNWSILAPRFANILGMTLWDGNFHCWYDVGVGQTLCGYWGMMDPVEMGRKSTCLVNWAQDPAASMANMVQDIMALKERGGKVITIDPRVTQTAALSDLHIRPRPGTDAALANAMANMIVRADLHDKEFIANHTVGFERYKKFLEDYTLEYSAVVTGVPTEQIQELALTFAKQKPLCLNLSRGALGKHSNGYAMVHAILCAFALTGNIGTEGGGTIWGESIEFDTSLQAAEMRPRGRDYPPNNLNSIMSALESGAVDMLLILGANPLSQWPEYKRLRKAFAKVKLIAVWDLFENKTAREVADLILPATCWVEELGLRATMRKVYLMEKVLEPQGECVECSELLKALAARLGHREDFYPWETKDEFLNAALKSHWCKGMTVDRLRRRPGGLESMSAARKPYADGVFRSPSRKFEFYSSVAEPLRLSPLPRHTEPYESEQRTPGKAKKYPLLLISSRRSTHFLSFHDSHKAIGMLDELEPEPVLHVNPRDAADRGISDGDYVTMFNDRGEARVKAELTHEVPEGMVSLNNCWPELNTVTPNYAPLKPEVTKALGCGGEPSYQDARIELRKG